MKSKFQKQQEAIDRKRKAFPNYIKSWCDARTKDTPRQRHEFGNDWVDRQLRITENALVKAAEEAHVDRHGNPLA